MLTEVFFDVETKKLFADTENGSPEELGISIVSVYTREVNEQMMEITGSMQSFWENQLDALFEIFKKATRIIGFNTLKFDIPVLVPYNSPVDLYKLPHLDIMQKVRESLGRSLSLNSLATATLGKAKIDTGINAVNYWNSHTQDDLEKLQRYCEEDVNITRDLYDYVLKNKFLTYNDKWNNRKNLPLDFSYPPEVLAAHRQIGLF